MKFLNYDNRSIKNHIRHHITISHSPKQKTLTSSQLYPSKVMRAIAISVIKTFRYFFLPLARCRSQMQKGHRVEQIFIVTPKSTIL